MVARVHDGLVGERVLLGTNYLADAEMRAQYEREIAPRTEAQLGKILAALPQGLVITRALDIGAGTGAAGRALRARFGDDFELQAIDKVASPGIGAVDVRRPIRSAAVTGRFDVIVAAHLLCELIDLDPLARAALVAGWCRAWLVPGGRCVLVEPALRDTSRALLATRDQLVRAGLFVEAPCFFQGPCPALARERDWCHDSAPWVARHNSPGSAAKGRADFSYLVLRENGTASTDAGIFRVVGDLRREKGRLRVFGCGPAGRHALVLQKRDETVVNQAFTDLNRGDPVVIDELSESGEGLRLGPSSAVVVRDPNA